MEPKPRTADMFEERDGQLVVNPKYTGGSVEETGDSSILSTNLGDRIAKEKKEDSELEWWQK